ncbi:MAG: tyrosine-type recombinase/integrase [Lachnospiraceae bacterium]|nr:tyrosine-type recombinase/integrase [Lachnospiraceae bacterium]
MPESSYYQDLELKHIDQIRDICDELPSYVRKFFRAQQQTKASRTRLGYAIDIKTFFEYVVNCYEKEKLETPKDVSLKILSDLSSDFIEDYMDYLQKYRKNGRVYTNGKASIKRKLSALSAFYAYYYKNNLVTQNPIKKVDMPRLKEKQIVRMDAAEVATFLDTVEYGNNLTKHQLAFHERTKTRDLAILSLMLSTGIRISECVGLNIKHVDFDNMCVKVTRKGGKEAIVYFSDEASVSLEQYMEQRKKIEAISGHEDALFLSSQKKRIGVRAVEKLVGKYAACAVPLKHITPHKLRSTYGTALYQETGDIYLVADVLGHSDVNTTRKHYADIENERKRSARNKVTLREKMDDTI